MRIHDHLVHVPGVGERSYERLRAIMYGASPIAEETLRRALDVFEAASTSPRRYSPMLIHPDLVAFRCERAGTPAGAPRR
jgi:hypothetical protein